MNFNITNIQFLIACLISVTAAWNELKSTESRRPFDLKGMINKKLGLHVALKDPNANIVSSPTAVNMLLTALALGAEQPSIGELEIALGIYNREELKATYRQIVYDLKNFPGSGFMKFAIRLYLDINSIDNATYCHDSILVFGTCLGKVNYNHPANTMRTINNWVSEQTDKWVPKIITYENVHPYDSINMVNAIYFSGFWKIPFESVNSESFHTIQGDRDVDMMTMTKIPYDGDAASFVLVLPLNHGGLVLTGIMQKIIQNPDLLRNEILNMTETNIELSLPKFNITSTLDLYYICKELDIKAIFNFDESGLKNIVEDETVYVTEMIQKASIEVNEIGAVDAAPTRIPDMSSSSKLEIKANYPFLFYVKSRTVQLFAGIYNGPEFKSEE